MKIVDCKTIEADNVDQLNHSTNTYIRKGWQPLGPSTVAVSKAQYGTIVRYAITMVKYEAPAEM